MRILLIGSFRQIALERIYAYNLRLLGHEVIELETFMGFHDGTETITGKIWHKLTLPLIRQRINKIIIQAYLKAKPDIVLIFKGEDITSESLEILKLEKAILVNFNPDHPLFFEKENEASNNIRQNVAKYDLYLTYSESIARQLRTRNIYSQSIPFGYDDRLIKALKSNCACRNAYLFVGAWDRERANWLSMLPRDIDLEIYGNQDWSIRSRAGNAIDDHFQNKYLLTDKYAGMVATSKGVINLLRPQNFREQSHNMRTFEVPGYGGVLLAQRTEEQMACFVEDEEAVFFDTQEELNDKLVFLNDRPELIKRIKVKARERSVKSGYSYHSRTVKLENLLTKLL